MWWRQVIANTGYSTGKNILARIQGDTPVRKMGIWREYLIEKLADTEKAINYLQAILEDYQIFEDPTVVLRSLHTVVEAQGGYF